MTQGEFTMTIEDTRKKKKGGRGEIDMRRSVIAIEDRFNNEIMILCIHFLTVCRISCFTLKCVVRRVE